MGTDERTFIPRYREHQGMKEGEDPDSWDSLFDQAESFTVSLQDIRTTLATIREDQ